MIPTPVGVTKKQAMKPHYGGERGELGYLTHIIEIVCENNLQYMTSKKFSRKNEAQVEEIRAHISRIIHSTMHLFVNSQYSR